jgi:peroxiredoxin
MCKTATFILSLAILLVAPTTQAQAQRESVVTSPVKLSGQTLEGKLFDLASLRGKVVLVVFWSTTCAVCRDKMPELRANYEGWRTQPFEMVLVSMDRRMQDWLAYEQILAQTQQRAQRFPQIWAGQAGYADSLGVKAQLPATFIVGKTGRVEKTYFGRIPAEAWDEIADLL